ncbi:MAG: hypothetical protein DWQ37_15980 [Planctomycetota bacterium]|nr:MAG: hypothetical protein DWQ37_15980 [Planctomycetota bacterium]
MGYVLVLGLGLTAVGAPRAEARIRSSARANLAKATSTAEPSCCTPEPVCWEPCIKYRHRGPKLCCGCEPGTPTVLIVKDPCTGCEAEVEVCLPACCEGDPTVCNGRGFLGRPTLEYEWCCGFQVRVAFKRCGDLVVTTWGR